MEQVENSFLIDILNILPKKVECFIQSPSLENAIIQEMFQSTDFDYYKVIYLDETNKDIFIRQELETSFSMYIQSIEIKEKGEVLFKGYDGVEYGTISKKIFIPEWFREKYIPDTCVVSFDW